jgi:hypothetical protein
VGLEHNPTKLKELAVGRSPQQRQWESPILGINFLFLNNVCFIPGYRRNLISISMLHEQLFSISFINNEIVISRNGLDICHART